MEPRSNSPILSTFEKKTTYTPDILQWVLRFGGDAEVMEPEALRFEVMWEAKRMEQ